MRRALDRRSQRGVTAVLVAILMTVLLLMVALVMEIGRQRMVRGQLQNGVDAAALAGAGALDGTVTGITNARTVAVGIAAQHVTEGTTSIAIDANLDVIPGTWSFTTNSFVPATSSTSPGDIQAVYVQAGRTAAFTNQFGQTRTWGNPMSTWFPGLLGMSTIGTYAVAVAVGGGVGAVKCGMPFAIPSCAIQPVIGAPTTFLDCCKAKLDAHAPDSELATCDAYAQPIQFLGAYNFPNGYVPPPNPQTMGFTLYSLSSTNNNGVISFLEDPNYCQIATGSIANGMTLQNGTDFNKNVYDALLYWMQTHGGTAMDPTTTNYVESATGLVPVFNRSDCPTSTFNQTEKPISFANLSFNLWNTWEPTWKIRLDATIHCVRAGNSPGGAFFGALAQPGLFQ